MTAAKGPASAWWDRAPFYPVLFAIATVLALFVESAAPTISLGRPMAIACGLTVALQLLVSGLARNRHLGAFFAALVFLAVLVPVGALALAGSVALVLAYRSIRAGRLARIDWARFTPALNVVAVALTGIGIVSAVTAGAFVQPSARPPLGQAAADAPDIYLLLVDAYPRADTLANDFQFDNGPFTRRMGELGFELAADSHSNYTLTALTLSSMFNYTPVQALLPDPPASAGAQLRQLDQVINDGSALKEVRALGYTVTAIPSQYTATDLHAVDQYLDSGEATDFEIGFLDEGLLPFLARDLQTRWVLEQNRSRIVTSFDRLSALADEPSAKPRVVFAHVMAPHRPIVFAADGSPVGDCSGDCPFDENDVGTDPDAGVRAATRGQVQHVNDLVFDTVSHIVQANQRPAVIVVFSDHGFRADWTNRTEMISNLFLARTPGHPGLFPNDTTLINVFPRILNAYAGTNLPLANEASYWTNMATLDSTGYLNFERVR